MPIQSECISGVPDHDDQWNKQITIGNVVLIMDEDENLIADEPDLTRIWYEDHTECGERGCAEVEYSTAIGIEIRELDALDKFWGLLVDRTRERGPVDGEDAFHALVDEFVSQC